jgi:uncharacterized coiled-coil DUF342 family protein
MSDENYPDFAARVLQAIESPPAPADGDLVRRLAAVIEERSFGRASCEYEETARAVLAEMADAYSLSAASIAYSELQGARATIATLEAELKESREYGGKYNAALQRLGNAIPGCLVGGDLVSEVEREVGRLQRKLAAVTRERDEALTEWRAIKKECGNYDRENDELNEECARLRLKIDSLTRELTEVQSERDELKTLLPAAVVNAENAQLSRELGEAKERLALAEATIKCREVDCDGRERELAEAREELRLSEPMMVIARNARWQYKGLDEAFTALDAHRARQKPDSGGEKLKGAAGADVRAGSKLSEDAQPVAPGLSDNARVGKPECLESCPGQGLHDDECPSLDKNSGGERSENKPRRVKLEPWPAARGGKTARAIANPLVDPSKHGPDSEGERAAVSGECDGTDCEYQYCPAHLRRGFRHDGGGERACVADEGAPAPGDTVRVLEWSKGSVHFGLRQTGSTWTVKTWDSDFISDATEKAQGFGYLRTEEEPLYNRGCRVEVVRRAQPAPQAEAKLAGVSGPHAEDVAELKRRVERLEEYLGDTRGWWQPFKAERSRS